MPIQAVDAHVFEQGVEAFALQAVLLLQGRIGPADVEAVRRNRVAVGDADGDRHRIDLHRGGGFDRVADGFEAHPAARVARHGVTVQSELDELAHARRVQHRDHRGDESVFALVRQGAAFAGVVVTGHQ